MEGTALKKLNWDHIINRTLSAYNVISKSINPANLYKIELTSSQIKVLATFAERDCYTMTELSQLLSVTLPTMTAMVDRLIQNGLVKRHRDENDRRVVLVKLTPEGKKVIDNIMTIRKQEIEKLFQVFSPQEVVLFVDSIEHVAQLLKKARTTQA
jgi:DNA-binding MarR family transcriptional regulator